MAKGKRLKPEKIVTLFHQIDVLKKWQNPVSSLQGKGNGRAKVLQLVQDLWRYTDGTGT